MFTDGRIDVMTFKNKRTECQLPINHFTDLSVHTVTDPEATIGDQKEVIDNCLEVG